MLIAECLRYTSRKLIVIRHRREKDIDFLHILGNREIFSRQRYEKLFRRVNFRILAHVK